MYQIDKKLFGEYVFQLRKEKGLTQKELAQRLYVSDKAVSKWERGASIPDVTLLMPLAEILGVTVTGLLECHPVEESAIMNAGQVEELVKKTLVFSGEDKQKAIGRRIYYAVWFGISIVITCLEIVLLIHLQYTIEDLLYNLLTVELLGFLFGCYFVLLAKDDLPTYYDENKISNYCDGIFHMNLPGVSINNQNWPYILRAGRWWAMGELVLFPLIYLFFSFFFPVFWLFGGLFITLAMVLGGLFIPMYVAAKRHSK
ncbi:MAG TPA: helix-turn-helix transcriptional regulator [Lachnospiraceae bacterium]|nr:helix-turn-helix transcriptional regulator [Lachnospiraceae bacterium]